MSGTVNDPPEPLSPTRPELICTTRSRCTGGEGAATEYPATSPMFPPGHSHLLAANGGGGRWGWTARMW